MKKIIDTHLHAHWPTRFKYLAPKGSRLAEEDLDKSAEGLDDALSANGVTHALLIQPGAYSHDNRAMLEKIAMSNGRYKGMASMPVETTSEEIDTFKTQGIVGVRMSMIHGGAELFDAPGIKDFLARCRERNFFVEVFGRMPQFLWLVPLLQQSGVRVIVEHMGYPVMAEGMTQPGWQELLKFGRDTDTAIKLSATFRVSAGGPPYKDLAPYIDACLEAFGPDRCMWGSDWPFMNSDNGPTPKKVPPAVAYEAELEAFQNLLPDDKVREQILFKTPARLFGFN